VAGCEMARTRQPRRTGAISLTPCSARRILWPSPPRPIEAGGVAGNAPRTAQRSPGPRLTSGVPRRRSGYLVRRGAGNWIMQT